MSRHICHGCRREHTPDNMVCYCAVCYDKAEIDAREQGRREAFEKAASLVPRVYFPMSYSRLKDRFEALAQGEGA